MQYRLAIEIPPREGAQSAIKECDLRTSKLSFSPSCYSDVRPKLTTQKKESDFGASS